VADPSIGTTARPAPAPFVPAVPASGVEPSKGPAGEEAGPFAAAAAEP
jgi:hypothetical protein